MKFHRAESGYIKPIDSLVQLSGRITDDWRLSVHESQKVVDMLEVFEKQGQFFVINSTVFWQLKESSIGAMRFALGFYHR